IGTEEKDMVEIVGGVNEGDFVITTGAGALRDGDRVSVPGGTGAGRGRRGGDATAGQSTGGAPSQGGQPSGTRQGSGRQGEFKRENTTDGRCAAREGSTGRESFTGRESGQSSGERGPRPRRGGVWRRARRT